MSTLELETAPAPAPVADDQPAAADVSRRRDAFRRVRPQVTQDRLNVGRMALAVALLAAGIWVCREAWREVFDYAWRDQEYSHILMVPFVAAFLVYVRRLRLRQFRVSDTWLGALLVMTGLLMGRAGLQGFDRSVLVMFHGGAVLVAVGCVVSALGKDAIFRFLPAVGVLLFLIPVPSDVRREIADPLQQWTAHISHVLLSLVGVDTTVAGNTLTVNGRPVTVAEACNGMRLVFPLLLLAFAFAFGLPLRRGVRVLLIVASPLVALACNVVRTLPTVWLYGYAPDWFAAPEQGRLLADRFHAFSGWAMLPLALLALLAIVRLMRWAMLPVQRYTLASQ